MSFYEKDYFVAAFVSLHLFSLFLCYFNHLFTNMFVMHHSKSRNKLVAQTKKIQTNKQTWISKKIVVLFLVLAKHTSWIYEETTA